MAEVASFEKLNGSKADLSHIYNQRDPRAYFRELRKLGYAIPGRAKPLFEALISQLRRDRQDPIHILDLGCSYGVNAALLKHDLSMSDLYEHWGSERLADAEPDEVLEQDRRFFDGLGDSEIEVIGLDNAENAVAFAEEAGILDAGIAANLEIEPLPAAACEELASVDLVTSTGCVGYVTEKSFGTLLPVVTEGRSPWMANVVLRLFPFEPIERELAGWGYVTEKLEGRTFVQRRFATAEEREGVLRQLRERGIDPAGKEEEGHLHAEFYLSRPVEEAGRSPLRNLLAGREFSAAT
jgi:SAM-dependent methyltransferase